MTDDTLTRKCWCGELLGPEVEWGDPPCDGSGEMDCYCGGDFCCCHNHGRAPCPGCEECERAENEEDE